MKTSAIRPLFLVVLGFVLLVGGRTHLLGAEPDPVFSQRLGERNARLQALLDHRTLQVRNDGSGGLQQRRLAGEKAPASLEAVLVMCDFSDSLMLGRHGLVPGDFPEPMQWDTYYTAHDSVYFDHLLGDVADYFSDVSGGRFSFNYTIHTRVVNLPRPMSFYGNHPEEGEQPLLLAAAVVDSLDGEVDFSLYDTVLLVHAGAGEETDILGDSPEQIYTTYLDPDDFAEAVMDSLLEQPYLPASGYAEGMGVDQVLILPETEFQDKIGNFAGLYSCLGVYCFEVGLRLGMLSLSDFTPSGRPDSQGIGEFGLMGYGLFVGLGYIPPHPCPFNKVLMGWVEPVTVGPQAEPHLLTPYENGDGADPVLKVGINGQEYWLITYCLQDPDGNRIFSFPGDLNGNNIPDFYDADSIYGNGMPEYGVAKFDPETDTRERLLGSEWNFFMSDNDARAAYVKGAGSGAYIWHIDEGVLRDVFGLPRNLFNADPARKSVDLEEADGIQDLDSREPSAWQLGGDEDSFRGEGPGVEFGPFSRPDTRTNGDVATGLRFHDFSDVVLDSTAYISFIDMRVDPPETVMGFSYADTLRFSLSWQPAAAGGPTPLVQRSLPAGFDPRGSHLLTADLDGSGLDEVVLAGSQGRIMVLDGALNEFLDRDGDPATVEPFAEGLINGVPVSWHLPPAVGDVVGDEALEIILSTDHGLYAFDAQGLPLSEVAGADNGLLHSLIACVGPPVLVPEWGDSLSIVAPVSREGNSWVVMGGWSDQFGAWNWTPRFLGQVQIAAQPAAAWGRLFVALRDTVGTEHYLRVLEPQENEVFKVALPTAPGDLPLSLGLVRPEDPDNSPRYVIFTDLAGHPWTVLFAPDLSRSTAVLDWQGRVRLDGPLAPGGAHVAEGLLARVSHNGEWMSGWPVRPLAAMAASPWHSAPLVCRLHESSLELDQFLFPARDGRIYALGSRGEMVSGFPLVGPAESAATPALGDLDGDGLLELIALGVFDEISGLDSAGENLTGTTVATLKVWDDVADSSLWPMWGGSPARNGNWDMASWPPLPGAADGTGLVEGSHFCYPNPLKGDVLYVQARSRGLAQARAELYNLEGERVTESAWQAVSAVEPFSIALPVDGIVSGMYLCRLTLKSQGGGEDHSVVSLAVVH